MYLLTALDNGQQKTKHQILTLSQSSPLVQ